MPLPPFRPTAAGLLCLALVLAAVFAPQLAPKAPLAADIGHRLSPPCPAFPLGSDSLGRCVLSRVVFGIRISLGGAAAASGLALMAGMLVGMTAALARGRAALCVTALIDMGLALPGLILAIVIAGLAGGSIQGLVLGLAAANTPWWARLIRGLALSAARQDYVLAGRAAGLPWTRIGAVYILPQFRAPVLSGAALKTGRMILAFAGLSYLGLGPPPPAPEWGRMLQEAGVYMTSAPWLILAPGMAITLTVAILNFAAAAFRGDAP